MSRKRRGESPISLFSFQDIITSVTAIMILLVLTLTLELITRMGRKGVAADDRKVVEELTQSIEAMRERCKQVEQQTADARKTAQRVASQSVQQLEAERRREQRQAESLRQELAALAIKAREARQSRGTAERELLEIEKNAPLARDAAERARRAAAAASELEERNQREGERQELKRNELGDQPRNAGKLVFNPPVGEPLKPLLIEVSGDGVAVMNESNTEVIDFGWGVAGPPGGFTAWLKRCDKTSEYIVIMLRPSGLDRLDATRRAVRDAGLELGVELVNEEIDIVMQGS